MLEVHVVLCVTEPDFFLKKTFAPKIKNGKNGPKIGFFEFIEKFSH